MPTPPPSPVAKPKNKEEAIRRETALTFFESFMYHTRNFAHHTRSHMPAALDHTEFVNAMDQLQVFFVTRPDWLTRVVEMAIGKTQASQDAIKVKAAFDVMKPENAKEHKIKFEEPAE
jgi:hypothetical protein